MILNNKRTCFLISFSEIEIALKTVFCCFIIFFANPFTISGQNKPNDIIVNYSGKQKVLKDVIIELAKNTKVNISFSDNLFPIDSIVDFSFKNKSVTYILESLLKKTNAEVTILSDDIVLTKRKDINQKYNLFGFVTDKESGERLSNAIIHFPALNLNTTSNDYGYYKISVPRGKHSLIVRYLAFKNMSKDISIFEDLEFNIKMVPLAMLNEILIKDKYDQEVYTSNQGLEIPLEMTHSFISIGGETNIMKYIGSSAGVSSSTDQISGISVRGGNPSQNLILMDGVPVYNADHALGLFSIFNNDILKSATFYKGAFPSRYNGSLSSVIDIKLKDGNNKILKGAISLGTFSAKAYIEGPIIKNKASFLFSIRRTTVDPWIKSFINISNTTDGKRKSIGNYYLYDINLKLNYKINNSNHIYFSNYTGSDKLNYHRKIEQNLIIDSTLISNDDYLVNYRNKIFSIRLNTQWGNSLFSNITAYSTSYLLSAFQSKHYLINDDIKDLTWYNTRLFKSKLKESGVKIDFDYLGISSHLIKFGTKLTNTNNNPGLLAINENNSFVPADKIPTSSLLENSFTSYNQSSLNISSYFEDEFLLFKNTHVNLGININSYNFENKFIASFDPRISLLFKRKGFNIVAGYSKMSQFNHLLANTGIGIPFNIWLPTSDNMNLEKGWISSLGFGFLWKDYLKFDIGLYYKEMKNIYSFKEGSLTPVTDKDNWANSLVSGEAQSYGIEFSSLKNIGKLIFDLNYTYSFVFNQYDDINLGRRYNGSLDRRHVLNLAITQRLNTNMEFSATWKIASGNPITIGTVPYIDTKPDGTPFIAFFIDKINNRKLPLYHRLDLGFNIYSDYTWGKQKISLGIINAYNNKNPYFIDIDVDGVKSISYKQYFLIPILPSITYSLSFK